MGQRFQIVFILPSVYMNEGNPNNRSEKILIFHNQWLFGRGALNVNLAIIERLKKAILKRKDRGKFAQTKQGFINHFLEDSVLNAITWASVRDLHSETRFSNSGTLIYSEEEEKPESERSSLSDLLKNQDNNNGFFICRIKENLELEFAFVNGLEDAEEHKVLTPKSYLNLFYSDEKLQAESLFIPMVKIINKFKEFGNISKEELEPILEDLNK